jgi:hypothetical protein
VKIERLSASYLKWQRTDRVADVLAIVDMRPFSSMWNVPDKVHSQLMVETAAYACQVYGSLDAEETVRNSFALNTVRWRDVAKTPLHKRKYSY